MIAAPVLFLMYDRWVDKRCPNWRLYAGYLASILFVMVTKHLALAGQGSDFVEPYLHSPLKPGFTSHVLLQFRSYAANLVLAQWTLPFESAEVIREVNSIWGLLILTGLLLGGTALLWKDGRFWFLLMLGGATWLPTSFVYLSERYLYLPSITFIGLMALLISSRTPPWRTALLWLLTFYTCFHSVKLYQKIDKSVNQIGTVEELASQIAPLKDNMTPGAHLLLVNAPGTFLRAQFAEEVLRILIQDSQLHVTILTMMPGQYPDLKDPSLPPSHMGATVRIFSPHPNELVLQGRLTSPGETTERV